MRDVENQLADYFDATVERVTVDDMVAGRVLEPAPMKPHRRLAARPAWALISAFAITLLVVGVPLIVGVLVGADPEDMGGSPNPPPIAGEPATGLDGFAIGVAIGLLVALALAAVRSFAIDRNGGVAMTTTLTRETVETDFRRLKTTNRILLITAIVLGLLAIGFAAWAVYGLNTEPDNAVSTEIQSLVDDYEAAWNNYDGDAFLALVTDDFRGDYGSGEIGAAYQASEINYMLGNYDWSIERIGDPTMSGDGPWYVVTTQRLTNTTGTSHGVSVLTVVDDGGMLRIAEHLWIGD